MSKKKIVIGILTCILLLIALSLLLIINNEKKSQNGGTMDGTTVEGQLLFSGMGVISEKYEGDIETKEIIQKMQEIVKKDIPELYKDIKKFDEKKLKKYYNNEIDTIKDKFGIQSEEEFIEFSNKINQTKINLNKWHKIKIDKESFMEKSDKTNYTYVEFDVIFENEEKLRFSLYISRKEGLMPTYIVGMK